MIISFSQLLSWIYDAVDTENESETFEPKGGKEAIDFKEVKRVDHILASLQRKVTCNFFFSYVNLLHCMIHISVLGFRFYCFLVYLSLFLIYV